MDNSDQTKVSELDEMAARLYALGEEYEAISKEKTRLSNAYDELGAQLIEKLTAIDKEGWAYGGHWFYTIKTNGYTVKDQDRLVDYMMGSSNKGMLTVNANKLRAWANEQAELNYGDVGIEPFYKTGIGVRKE